MGGLVVKEMLYEAKLNNLEEFVKNTIGVVRMPFCQQDSQMTSNDEISNAGIL